MTNHKNLQSLSLGCSVSGKVDALSDRRNSEDLLWKKLG
jgi:hypothetical protein